MKFRSSEDRPKANKIFTDRDEPRNVFWKKYEQVKKIWSSDTKEKDITVLSYYGIGGIGKTSLIKQIIKEMKEKIAKPLFVYYNFNYCQDCRGVLENIRNILVNDYRFKFPLFDLSLYIYLRKAGEDVSAPVIKSFTERSEVLNNAISFLENIPVPLLSISASLTKLADSGIAAFRNIAKKHKEDIDENVDNTPEELLKNLPSLFAKDLSDNLEDREEPLVVFLDTYERLVNEMSSVGDPLSNDDWIRRRDGLIINTKNVLWVITGREKLKWERFDSGWNESLEQHMLGSLSETDGITFLEKAGVLDERLRKDLYDITKGTPVYLDLCVDNYYALVQKGKYPTKADFGDNYQELIERFVRYMDNEIKDIVYILAVLQVWNDELIKDILSKKYPVYLSRYEIVKDYSFISTVNDNFYTIHQTVGDVLIEKCPEDLKNYIYINAANYYEYLLSHSFNENYTFYLEQYVRFSLKIVEENHLIEFFNKNLLSKIKGFYNFGAFDPAKKILELFSEKIKEKKSENYAFLLAQYAEWADSSGKFIDAKENAEESLELYKQLYGNESKQYISALSLLGKELNALGEYDKSIELTYELLDKQKRILGDNHPDTLVTMGNIAVCLDNLGRHEEALKLHYEVLFKHKKLFGDNDYGTLMAKKNVALCLDSLKRYEEALKFHDDVLTMLPLLLEDPDDYNRKIIDAESDYGMCLVGLGRYKVALRFLVDALNSLREILGEDHPETIKATNNIAMCLKEQKKYKSALVFLKKVFTKQQERLGEDHPDTIIALSNYAGCLRVLGRTEEALILHEKVLVKFQKLKGENDPDTIDALYDYAICLDKLGRTEEALKFYKKALSKQKEQLGECHPNTIRSMNTIVSVLVDLERYEEALILQKEIFNKQKEIFGENHPDTIIAIEAIAICLGKLGRDEEALEFHKKVLSKRKELLGETHPDTIDAMNEVATTLAILGRYDELLNIQQEILSIRQKTLGDSHLKTLRTMHIVAGCLDKLGRHEEALGFHKKVLSKRKELLGDINPDTIVAMNGVAECLKCLGRDEEAGEYRNKILHIIVTNQDEVLNWDHSGFKRVMRSVFAEEFKPENLLKKLFK